MNYTTTRTKNRAETLSMWLNGEITKTCKHYISLGESECKCWIKRMEQKYNIFV